MDSQMTWKNDDFSKSLFLQLAELTELVRLLHTQI